MLFTR